MSSPTPFLGEIFMCTSRLTSGPYGQELFVVDKSSNDNLSSHIKRSVSLLFPWVILLLLVFLYTWFLLTYSDTEGSTEKEIYVDRPWNFD